MSAYNVVRFKVKLGKEKAFEDAHRKIEKPFRGNRKFVLVNTGDRTYCVIGEWNSMNDIINARPEMGKILDSFRDTLEDLGGGLGVTDPVSGEAVVELGER